ncbi:MAG: hypothetical protein SFZ24_09275 [Planctomycetota bacterium]|nr:hypothetical protein [Planctomycetota bacterium]
MHQTRRPSLHLPGPRGLARGAAAAALGLLVSGCSSGPDERLRVLMDRGRYAQVAARAAQSAPRDRSDREYMLSRMRLALALLADGRPRAAEPVVTGVFDVLRTQGINDDKTVAATVLGEGGVLFYKGEPFEQALMFHYIGVQKALLGEWDNARASFQSSLFLLKDFGENERGERRTTEDIAEEAYRRERSGDGSYEGYLEKGYTPVETDFALGYFMSGVANLALAQGDPAREDEARDNFREAFELVPELKAVADALVERRANALFVVDFGPGPEKVRYGPDGALARFEPRLRDDTRAVSVTLRPEGGAEVAKALNVNAMAADHMWNNFEDVRQAKSSVGNALLLAGAFTAASGRNDSFGPAQIVGLSLVGAGLFSKLTAGADTRHCELFPQRVYVAAVQIPPPAAEATVSVGATRLVLPGVPAPESDQALSLRYIRVPMAVEAERWARAGRVAYANDSYAGRVPGDDLPYILGGRCVRRPSDETLRRYQSSGNLLDMTVNDLAELYRLEGIVPRDPPMPDEGLHLLEGGTSLDAPIAGSAGFARVFCQDHRPYEPRSREVAELSARLRERAAERSLDPLPSAP